MESTEKVEIEELAGKDDDEISVMVYAGRGQSSIGTIVHKDKSPLDKSPLDICPEGHLSQTFFLSRYGLFDII